MCGPYVPRLRAVYLLSIKITYRLYRSMRMISLRRTNPPSTEKYQDAFGEELLWTNDLSNCTKVGSDVGSDVANNSNGMVAKQQ